MTTENIAYYWENDLCPIVNGIIFADGSIRQLNPKESSQQYYDIPEYSGIETIDKLREKEEIGITNIYKRKPIQIAELNILIYCGDGSWGGEGFVAVCEKYEGREMLKWIAYFDYSNPMEKVEYIDSNIVAYSNLGHRWIFNIDRPQDVSVEF